MSQAVILVWVSVTTGSAAPHVGEEPTPHARTVTTFDYTTSATPSQRRAITAWAQSHLLSIAAPATDAATGPRGYDSGVVERIEELLEQARVSAGSLDDALALEQLALAEALIYEHPELPQAGFLLAEAAAQQAPIVEHAGQARLAQIQRLRAATLEGERVRPYAAATEVHSTSSDARGPNAGSRDVTVTGLATGDTLVWNGSPIAARRLTVPIGEHHVQVLRDSSQIWAGFLLVHDADREIRVPVAPPAPCSRADLSVASVRRDHVIGSQGVRCPLWAIARPAAGKGIDVALCRRAECGSLMNWQEGFGEPLVKPLHEAHPWRLPSWAGYVAAGVGAAAATSLILWQSGAFDDPEEQPRSFTFGGIEE
ncbi:MAG TPA: hypothetical protein VI197_08055 [Polyangiaceae bacterium]